MHLSLQNLSLSISILLSLCLHLYSSFFSTLSIQPCRECIYIVLSRRNRCLRERERLMDKEG